MQTIQVFLASSAELKTDREAFRVFLSVENDRLHPSGTYLELIQWEYFLNTMSGTRLQDDYNKAITSCDLMVSLFDTKAGRYTTEEFDIAYNSFKEQGKPLIWTYFKQSSPGMPSPGDEDPSLAAFKKKIDSLGHFYTTYNSIDNLKYQFKLQLEYILPKLIAPGRKDESLFDLGELRKISQQAEKIYNINHIDKADFS